jgi:hypothetical protein
MQQIDEEKVARQREKELQKPASGRSEDNRLPWETPRLFRLNARKAEHGLLLGPEAIVLLRS